MKNPTFGSCLKKQSADLPEDAIAAIESCFLVI